MGICCRGSEKLGMFEQRGDMWQGLLPEPLILSGSVIWSDLLVMQALSQTRLSHLGLFTKTGECRFWCSSA